MDQHYAMWRPGHDEYVFRSSESGRLRYFLASADGPAVREITFPDGGVFGARVSPDGSTLVYVPGDGSPGPLHALDIDTGHDRLLTQPGDGYEWSNPQFSPDGTQILAERHPAPADGTSDVVAGMDSLVLLPVDGAGPIEELSLPSFTYGQRCGGAVLTRRDERACELRGHQHLVAARHGGRTGTAARYAVRGRFGVAATRALRRCP